MPQFVYHPDIAALNAQGLPNSLPTIDLPTNVPNGYADIRRPDDFVPYNPAIVEATIVPAGTKSYRKPVGPANPPTWKAIFNTVSKGIVGTGSQNMATGNVQSVAGTSAADNSGQTNSGAGLGAGSKSVGTVSPGGSRTA